MTSQRSRTVGIIGGMGPAATVDLIAKITQFTPARRDQDHLRLLVDSNPGIPDRSLAVTGDGPSPAPAIVASARLLEGAGASLLVIACNTAHHWLDEVAAAVSVPIVSMIEVTVEAALRASPSRVGVMATTACLTSRMYQERLEARQIESVTLPRKGQREFMNAIASIKAHGPSPSATKVMSALAEELVHRGADVLIAGCTEVPLVLDGPSGPALLVSSTDELARATVRAAMAGTTVAAARQ